MKSLDELKTIRDKMQGQMGIRNENTGQTRIMVGMATCGIASGARSVLNTFSDLVQEKGLTNITFNQTDCIGLCQYEPIVEIMEAGKDKVTYIKMTPEKAREILEKHIIKGEIVGKYTMPEKTVK